MKKKKFVHPVNKGPKCHNKSIDQNEAFILNITAVCILL